MDYGLTKFLLIEEVPDEHRGLLYRYLVIRSGDVLAFGILATYLILYILDIISVFQFGIIIAVKLSVQTLLDYPSGTLGDYIGQRTVMVFAFISYIGALLVLYFAQGFVGFLVGYVFFGISNSQESGALISWLDNGYSEISQEFDPDRQIYGAFMGRVNSIHQVLLLISLVLGGLISDYFGRRNVIIVSFVWVIVTLALIIVLMEPHQNQSLDQPVKSLRSYFSSLPDGIRYVKNTPGLLFFYIGLGLSISTIGNIYDELIQYPLFSNYLVQDKWVGFFQATILLLSVFAGLLMSYLSKFVKNDRIGFIVTIVFTNFVFYIILSIFTSIIDYPTAFQISIFILLVLVFQIGVFFNPLFGIFFRRIQIEIVPSNIRNAVYSLLPTIITSIGIFLSIIGGSILDRFNHTIGLLFVSTISFIGIVILSIGLLIHQRHLEEIGRSSNSSI